MAQELVIVPIYNEAPSVATVIAEIRRHTDADILAIDDGSTDGTSEILDQIPAITVLRHDHNLGYGQSLIDGFHYAAEHGYCRAVTIDCDEQHEPALIPAFLEDARRWDIVSGSRYLLPEPREGAPPPDRLQINREITAQINRLTAYALTDAFCGFKAYRVEALAGLSLSEPGYGFPLQFWIQAARAGLVVRERPIPLIYKNNFERRFGGGLDDAARRLAYYRQVIASELARQPGPLLLKAPEARKELLEC